MSWLSRDGTAAGAGRRAGSGRRSRCLRRATAVCWRAPRVNAFRVRLRAGGISVRLGLTETLMIIGVALLVFGGKALGQLGKGMGEGIRNFKSAMNEKDDPKKPS